MRYKNEADRQVFQCDASLCVTEVETGEGRAMVAAEIIKTKGWAVVKHPWAGRPYHYCPKHKEAAK